MMGVEERERDHGKKMPNQEHTGLGRRMESHGRLWNFMELHGTSGAPPYIIQPTLMEPHGISWKAIELYGMPWKEEMENSGMFHQLP